MEGTGHRCYPPNRTEPDFFKAHEVLSDFSPLFSSPSSGSGSMAGTETFRRRLMDLLESYMAYSLHHVTDTVELKPKEAQHKVKAQYQDRWISAESHVASKRWPHLQNSDDSGFSVAGSEQSSRCAKEGVYPIDLWWDAVTVSSYARSRHYVEIARRQSSEA